MITSSKELGARPGNNGNFGIFTGEMLHHRQAQETATTSDYNSLAREIYHSLMPQKIILNKTQSA
jgi:hypothetical protein